MNATDVLLSIIVGELLVISIWLARLHGKIRSDQ